MSETIDTLLNERKQALLGVELAQTRLEEAQQEVAAAESAIGEYLAPADMEYGGVISVWHTFGNGERQIIIIGKTHEGFTIRLRS